MKASIIAVLSIKLTVGGRGYKIQARDVLTNHRFEYIGGLPSHPCVADWLEQRI